MVAFVHVGERVCVTTRVRRVCAHMSVQTRYSCSELMQMGTVGPTLTPYIHVRYPFTSPACAELAPIATLFPNQNYILRCNPTVATPFPLYTRDCETHSLHVQVTDVDKSAPTVSGCLSLSQALSKSAGARFAAERLIPVICPLLASPSTPHEQFTQALKCVCVRAQLVCMLGCVVGLHSHRAVVVWRDAA